MAVAGVRIAASNTPEDSWFQHLGAATLGAGAATILLVLGAGFIPVVIDMQGEIIRSKAGEVVISFTATKVRDCHLLGREAYAVGASKGMRKAYIENLADPTPGATRPLGFNDLGEWKITYDPSLTPTGVVIVTHHNCGKLLGQTDTTTGPFSIPGR